MRYNILQLQLFFFEAACATYASGKKATKFGHEREFRHVSSNGSLVYIDRYVVNGEYSGGNTVILVEDVPIWLMQYHGWCKNDNKQVLDFLKKCLLISYGKGEWNGGRGPAEFIGNRSENLVYENIPRMPPYGHNFRSFQGRERIYRIGNRVTDLFWHLYQGLLLGDLE